MSADLRSRGQSPGMALGHRGEADIIRYKVSFPKHVKRQTKNRVCSDNAMFEGHVLEKNSS